VASYRTRRLSTNLCGASSRLGCGQKITREQWINLCGKIFFFCGATRACTASFLRFLDCTKTNLKGWIPLKELSTGGKALYLHNTHRTKETKIHALSGMRNRNPSNQAVEDSRLRPQGHLDRHEIYSWV